jgi:uncharacterized protein (DUF4415 family)
MTFQKLGGDMRMTRPPNRYRPTDPRTAAEAAFKKATSEPASPVSLPKTTSLPTGKELVSLRIDRDVLEHFQQDGPGWQDRINAALRNASGLDTEKPDPEGIRPERLTSENDG